MSKFIKLAAILAVASVAMVAKNAESASARATLTPATASQTDIMRAAGALPSTEIANYN